MKGKIFTEFSEFIENKYSLDLWLTTLDSCELESNGEYLSTEIYQDDEFMILLDALALALSSSREALFREFGEYIFPTLLSAATHHLKHVNDLFEFLKIVDSIIHVEVQKTDPLAYTPTMLYDQPNENLMIIRYVSKRKMCFFAEGLIIGASKYFKQTVEISQTQCMCKGDEYCLIRIQK